MKITPASISTLLGGVDVTAIKEIKLANKEIDEIDDLSPCVELRKLDLSSVCLFNYLFKLRY
jgi:hypothetical protein